MEGRLPLVVRLSTKRVPDPSPILAHGIVMAKFAAPLVTLDLALCTNRAYLAAARGMLLPTDDTRRYCGARVGPASAPHVSCSTFGVGVVWYSDLMAAIWYCPHD